MENNRSLIKFSILEGKRLLTNQRLSSSPHGRRTQQGMANGRRTLDQRRELHTFLEDYFLQFFRSSISFSRLVNTSSLKKVLMKVCNGSFWIIAGCILMLISSYENSQPGYCGVHRAHGGYGAFGDSTPSSPSLRGKGMNKFIINPVVLSDLLVERSLCLHTIKGSSRSRL